MGVVEGTLEATATFLAALFLVDLTRSVTPTSLLRPVRTGLWTSETRYWHTETAAA